MTPMEKQINNINRVLAEANLFTTGKKQIENLENFLEDYWGSTKVRPFTCQFINDKIGVRWDFDRGYLSVLFGSDDNWEWKSESTTADPGIPNVYNQSFSYAGPPSYTIKDCLYFSLPTEVEKVITIPDEFTGTYTPIFTKYEYDVIWVTGKYDGMLSGYCRYNGKVHYLSMVEETDFTRRRMFKVYELSLWERTKVWIDYFRWHTVLCNGILWNIYTKIHSLKWKLSGEKRHEIIAEKRKQFEAAHKVVGYFEG